MKQRKLFCEINPFFYKLSCWKESFRRSLKDLLSNEKIARHKSNNPFPTMVMQHSSVLVRRLHNVDITLQENKVTNIKLAAQKINGLVVYPGETFSFWRTVGKTTAKKGYKPGLVITKSKVSSGIGGGLCQMANMVHWLVLNSPLTVTELHHHTDALFPDEHRRVPFGTGTSISYKSLDYRFKNNTNQAIQILVWCEDGELKGELRTENDFTCRYKLVETDHHFEKLGDNYYRNSKVWRMVYDREANELLTEELILDNHSLVMYDHSLIPQEQIKNCKDAVTPLQ